MGKIRVTIITNRFQSEPWATPTWQTSFEWDEDKWYGNDLPAFARVGYLWFEKDGMRTIIPWHTVAEIRTERIGDWTPNVNLILRIMQEEET